MTGRKDRDKGRDTGAEWMIRKARPKSLSNLVSRVMEGNVARYFGGGCVGGSCGDHYQGAASSGYGSMSSYGNCGCCCGSQTDMLTMLLPLLLLVPLFLLVFLGTVGRRRRKRSGTLIKFLSRRKDEIGTSRKRKREDPLQCKRE